MPEGDTIFRLARDLSPLMTGRTIRLAAGRAPLLSRLEGTRVASVTSRGKHLLVGVAREGREAQTFVRTHLGLHGAWHVYARGARWRKHERRASLRLDTDEHTFVCFDAKEVDCVSASHLDRHPRLRRLGPDLLAPGLEWGAEEILARFRARPVDGIAQVILDQSISCGIGNVYKSEVLFLTGHAPLKPSSALSDEEVRGVFETARRLLRANRDRPLRITTGVRPDSRRPRLWVYERTGLPCFRCDGLIAFVRTLDARPTYWCRGCQR